MDHKRVDWLHKPCRLGTPQRFRAGEGGGVSKAHKWPHWLHNLCRLGCLQCYRAAEKLSSGP